MHFPITKMLEEYEKLEYIGQVGITTEEFPVYSMKETSPPTL